MVYSHLGVPAPDFTDLKLAPTLGIEPSSHGLTVRLHALCINGYKLVASGGIEPLPGGYEPRDSTSQS